MAAFALRPCARCKQDHMARVSSVSPFGRVVLTTQCWTCGTAVVEQKLTLREALAVDAPAPRRKPYQPIVGTP